MLRNTYVGMLLLGIATSPLADTFPSRPVRLIAPFPAGGGIDIVGRQLAQKLTEKWSQQVVVDNRAGATGIIGTDLAAHATPDGYTLVVGNVATHAVNVSLYQKLPYDPVKDFAPITLVARVPEVLVVHPSLAASSVKDLIALAGKKPGTLTVGTAGSGSPPHLAAELFQLLAKVQFVVVPYKGSTPALVDLTGGQINLYFANVLSAAPLVKGGRLRALGVTSAKRSVVLPEVPTVAEAGVSKYEEYNWYGILAPRGVPAPVLAKLNADIVAVLRSPDVEQKFVADGAEVIANTPQEFAKFIRSEIDKYAAVVKQRGLKAQ